MTTTTMAETSSQSEVTTVIDKARACAQMRALCAVHFGDGWIAIGRIAIVDERTLRVESESGLPYIVPRARLHAIDVLERKETP